MDTSFLFNVGMAGLGRRPLCLNFSYFLMNPVILHLTMRAG
jgi:hypothetical protein